MRLITPAGSELWLTYCMNVHPGGSLESTLEAIDHTVLPLRERLDVRGPFGLGLRLDGAAIDKLHREPRTLAAFGDLLEERGLVAFTANAFVVGVFHGRRVKEAVYAPTWADVARVDYTTKTADVLARLPGPSKRRSISTSPGSWRAWGEGPAVDEAAALNLASVARHLRRIEAATGCVVRLGLEPEPGCTIQTVEEAIRFFEGPLAAALGDDEDLHRALGLCYDVCHQAVMHEDVEEGLRRLGEANVPIVKVQASSALEVSDPAEARARRALAGFDEEVYLHQVGARDEEGRLHVATDLPLALDAPEVWNHRCPWRIHFHVPVFRREAAGSLGTTRAYLDRALAAVARGDVTDHLEIETYTWEVLPEAERRAGSGFDLVETLAREYESVLAVLEAHGVRREGVGGGAQV